MVGGARGGVLNGGVRGPGGGGDFSIGGVRQKHRFNRASQAGNLVPGGQYFMQSEFFSH